MGNRTARLAAPPAPRSAEGPRGDGSFPGPDELGPAETPVSEPTRFFPAATSTGKGLLKSSHRLCASGAGPGWPAVDSPCPPPREALGSPRGAGTGPRRRLGKLRAGPLAAVSPPDPIPGPADLRRGGPRCQVHKRPLPFPAPDSPRLRRSPAAHQGRRGGEERRRPGGGTLASTPLTLGNGGAVRGIHGEGAGAQSGSSPRVRAQAPQEGGGEAGAWSRGGERWRTGRFCAECRPLEACPPSPPRASSHAVVSSGGPCWEVSGTLMVPAPSSGPAWLPLPSSVGRHWPQHWASPLPPDLQVGGRAVTPQAERGHQPKASPAPQTTPPP